jgi:hypothetical protein
MDPREWATDISAGWRRAMPEARCFKVPDSLVFFSFVGLWVGWMVWRWRREARGLANEISSMKLSEE